MDADYAFVYRNLVEACRAWSPCPCEKILSVSLKALELNPQDSTLLLFIGHEYDYCKKDKQKAIDYYTLYLKTRPLHQDEKKLIKTDYTTVENRLRELKGDTKNKK